MIKIYTYAHKRPDFISIQHDSIKKYVKDSDYEYIVFNNAIDDESLSLQIEEECKKLNIKTIKVELHDDINKQKGDGYEEYQFNSEGYFNANVGTSYPLIWSYRDIISKEDNENLVVIIDSDMFFMKEISIIDLMSGYDIAFIPQYRDNGVYYMWNGFVIMDGSKIELNKINWFCGLVNGQRVDVGGQTHYYLKDNPQLKVLNLEFWNLTSVNNNEYISHLNGNVCVKFLVNKDKLSSYQILDNFFADNKLFEYEIDRGSFDDYIKYYADNIIYVKKFIENLEFPKPEHIDFIKCYDKNIEDSFILHYKSGSNYLNFQNGNYNENKTKALKKFMESI
jgi:hypothetical protein